MKQIKKQLLILLYIVSVDILYGSCSSNVSCNAPCVPTKTIAAFMPQGADLKTQYHRFHEIDECPPDLEFDFDLTYRYQASNNGCDIARMLFNSSAEYNSCNANCAVSCFANNGNFCNLRNQSARLSFQGSNYGLPSATPLYPGNANPQFNWGASLGSRDPNALLADYFGMGASTNVSINICPKIKNNIIDFRFGIAAPSTCKGLWFQMNLPVINSDWQINACSSQQPIIPDKTALQAAGSYTLVGADTTPGPLSSPALFQERLSNVPPIVGNAAIISQGSFINSATTPQEIPVAYMGRLNVATNSGQNPEAGFALGSTINQLLINAASSLPVALSGYIFGDLTNRAYNKINLNMPSNCAMGNCISNSFLPCKTSTWALDGIYMQLGYDAFRCDDYHLGFYAKAVIPTGTQINQLYMTNTFSPLVGGGRHFELGGGFTSHKDIWHNNEDNNLYVNLDGYITHVFSKNQFRTFDVTNNLGVVLPMSRYMLLKQFNVTNPAATTPLADMYSCNGKLIAAGDANATCIDVSAAIHGEIILDLIYHCCDWTVGLGYSFKGQSKETSDTIIAPSNNFYGFKGTTAQSDIITTVFANGATAGGFSINAPAINQGIFVKNNSDVDTQATAYNYNPAASYAISGNNSKSLTTANSLFQLPQPNRSGLMEAQALNIIFGHIDYVWSEISYKPSVSILGSASFSSHTAITAQYWDIGARLGFSF